MRGRKGFVAVVLATLTGAVLTASVPLQGAAGPFARLADPVRSWEGIEDAAGGGGHAPSGAAGAVGPTRYLELVDAKFALYDRTNDAALASGGLSQLLPDAPPTTGHGGVLTQPQALWDPATNRFYYSFLDLDPPPFTGDGTNYIAFGFSKDAAPSSAADFCRYELGFDGAYGPISPLPAGDAFAPDSLRMGDTAHNVLFGLNVTDWALSSGVTAAFGSDVDWVAKPPAGTTCPSADAVEASEDTKIGIQDPTGHAMPSPVPAVQVDSTGLPGWVVASKLPGNGSAAQLSLIKVTDGAGGLPAFAPSVAVPVASYNKPALAPQPGGVPIDTGDGSLTQAVAAIDPARGAAAQALWTQHTVAGGAGSQVRWYELNPAAKTVYQSGSVSDPSLSVFNGSIAPDRLLNGGTAKFGSDLVLGADTSSASVAPAVQWVAKEGTGAQTGLDLVQQSPDPVAGFGCDVACLWGGAAASADPGADSTVATGQVWLTSPWASGTGGATAANWRTQNLAVHVPLSPPAITTFSPPSGPVGTPVTISGSRFLGISAITVGGASAFPPLAGSTATALKITVPAGAVTGKIVVANDGGSATSAASFKVTPKITPWPIAAVQVGDTAHIPGTNLTNDDGTTPGVLKLGTLNVGATAAPGELTFAVPDVVSNKLTVSINPGPNASSYTTPTNLLIRPRIDSVSAGPFTTGSTVTLTGKTFTGTTAVKFAGFSAPVSATSFKVVSAATLTAVVPAGAVGGPVTVTNAGGSTTSGTPLTIAPKATAISPTSGPVGMLVTITGTNLDGTATATVGGAALTDLEPVSATQLKGRIGDGAVTGATVVTTTTGGTGPAGPIFKVTPNITSVDQSPVQAGTPVVATGTNLDEATVLKIGTVAVPFGHDGPTRVTFTTPATAVTGALTVTSLQGTTVTSTILHIRPKLNDTLVPAEGAAGTVVKITGSTLTGTTAVKFKGFDGQPSASATFKVTAGVLTATVPPTAISGSILVTNAGGSTGTTDFTVDPKATSLTPPSAPVGALLTIAGSGFDSGTTATFTGNVAAAQQQAGTTATALKVLVPDNAQTGPITVDTNSSSVNAVTTSFKVAPRIDTRFPDPVSVGAPVSVDGLNLGDAPVTVKLGAITVARLNATETHFDFLVPATAVSAKVTITTATGTATSQDILRVTPTVATMTPAQGAAGASVTITGQALGDASAVNFTGASGAVPAAFSKIAGGVKATVPAAAVTGPVTVHTGGGDAPAGGFVVLPKITSFSPASGPSAGTTVTIKGTGLQNGATVSFAGSAVTGSGGGTQITAKVPPGAATGKITVTNSADPGPPSATSASSFTVSLGITSFTPAFAEPTDDIVLTGIGFSASSKVFFGGDGTGPGTIAATATAYSPTTKKLTVRAPAGSNGRITVKASTASNAPATWSAAKLQMLDVDSISPPAGPAGQVVTITGSGFEADDVVTYNAALGAPFDTPITDFQVTDGGTHLTFTTPDGHFDTNAPTVITVAPPNDLDAAHAKSTEYAVNLGIDSVAPPSGPIGNSLTIDGAFPDTHTYTAALNGTPIPDLSIHGGGRLTAHVPFGATSGKITITDTTPATPVTVTSPSTFTITLRLTPYTGPTGTVVTATGLNFAHITVVNITGHADGDGGSTVPATPSGNGSSLTFTIPADVPTGSAAVMIQPLIETSPGSGTYIPLGASSTSPFVVTADPVPYAGPH